MIDSRSGHNRFTEYITGDTPNEIVFFHSTALRTAERRNGFEIGVVLLGASNPQPFYLSVCLSVKLAFDFFLLSVIYEITRSG